MIDLKWCVNEAIRTGSCVFPLPNNATKKEVRGTQRRIHRYAGAGKVETHRDTQGNITIVRKSEPPVVELTKYSFEVGDSGLTICGEPYVVLQKKRDGRLLVNVKSKGVWKIGLRNSDGTCVYNYPNGYRYALAPSTRPAGTTTRLFLKELADLTERYGGVDFYYTTDDDGIHLELLSESIECRVGFDTSPKRLREVANFLV